MRFQGSGNRGLNFACLVFADCKDLDWQAQNSLIPCMILSVYCGGSHGNQDSGGQLFMDSMN